MTTAAASSSNVVSNAHVNTAHAPQHTEKTFANTIDAKHNGVGDIGEVHEAKPKLDHYDKMKVGAPSPDCSGLIDDADPELDPSEQVPTIPSRALNNRVRA